MTHEGKVLDSLLDHLGCIIANRDLALHQIDVELDTHAGNDTVTASLERIFDILTDGCEHTGEQ